MRSKIACVVCGNGLGHLKRTIEAMRVFIQTYPHYEVMFFIEPSHQGYLKQLANFPHGVQVLSLPLKWSLDEQYYTDGSPFEQTYHALAQVDFSCFDFIYSDNLVEPVCFHPRVILGGSFLWHDVLLQAYPQSPSVQTYFAQMDELLQTHQPSMLANEQFAMPYLSTRTNVKPIGLVHFAKGVIRERPFQDLPQSILLALGNNPSAGGLLKQITDDLLRLQQAGITLLAEASWQEALSLYEIKSRSFDFHDGWEEVDLVITRAGMGTISDCIAMRIPMLTVAESNPEIQHNQAILHHAQIALSLSEFIPTALQDYGLQASHFDRFRVDGITDMISYFKHDAMLQQWINQHPSS